MSSGSYDLIPGIFWLIVFPIVAYFGVHLLAGLIINWIGSIGKDPDDVYMDSNGIHRRYCSNHPVTFGITRYKDGSVYTYWTDNVTGEIITDKKGMAREEKARHDRIQKEIEIAEKYEFKVYYDPEADRRNFPLKSHNGPLKEISTGRYCYPDYDEMTGEFFLQYLEEPKIKEICWEYQKADKKPLTIEEFEHYNPYGYDVFWYETKNKAMQFFLRDGGNYKYEKIKFSKKRLDDYIYEKARDVANSAHPERLKCHLLVTFGYIKSLDDYDKWIDSFCIDPSVPPQYRVSPKKVEAKLERFRKQAKEMGIKDYPY